MLLDCRNTTLQGNWAEERLAADVPTVRPKFQGETTSHSDYGPQVCSCLSVMSPPDRVDSACRHCWFDSEPGSYCAIDTLLTASMMAVQGKGEAAAQYRRHDLTCTTQNSNKDMFAQQADPAGNPVHCYATINQLAYGEDCSGRLIQARGLRLLCPRAADHHNQGIVTASLGPCLTSPKTLGLALPAI